MDAYGRERRLSIDRLSELPDSVLCQILAFLPTRTSVSTSVLSKRWRFVWKSVPNLYFECENIHIVTRMLWLRKHSNRRSPTILKSLTILLPDCSSCDEFEVETCFIFAIDLNVRYLHLFVLDHKLLPSRLFTCKTLVDLALYECGEIRTINRVCLPSLRKLFLKWVEFEDDESLPRLLSGCPVLEYLRIESNFQIRLTSWYISSPSVKWLRLKSLVGSLDPSKQGYVLEINTPALEYLSVHDCLSGPIECGNLTSLVAADICHQHYDIGKDDIFCGVSLLKFVDSLSNVKSLKLDLSDYAMIMDSLLSAWAPSFDNLTKLDLTADSSFLSKFLDNANSLKILIFRECSVRTEGRFQHEFREQTKGWIEPQQVPKCLLSCLRTIKIVNTLCTEDGLEIIRYFLMNAKVLTRMDIAYPRHINAKEKNDMLQKVSLFKRGSEACELAFTKARYEDSFEGYWERIGINLLKNL